MEAGNRCFDERVPEETNRRIVDHIADINMPYSAIAREYLLREGIAPDRVITTGSPMYEVLHHYLPTIQASDVLSRLGLTPRGYYVVSVHREENVDNEQHFDAFISVLRQLSGTGLPIVVSTHPRTRKWLDERHVQVPPGVSFLKPLGFLDYVQLELNARCTMSDSGTITEESNILGFPALNVREAHERPEGMEETAVIMTGLRPERVVEALKVAEGQPRGTDRTLCLVPDYAVPNVSEKVLRIILSYTDYVRRVVWNQR
jgi:UDP-N-acetylglucosamine 2-epimerase (non-hydrolysing)